MAKPQKELVKRLVRGLELQTRDSAFRRRHGQTRDEYLAEQKLAGVRDSKAKKDFARLADAANEFEQQEEAEEACALARGLEITSKS